MLPLRGQQYLTPVAQGAGGSQADTMAAPQTALPVLERSAATSWGSLVDTVTGSRKLRRVLSVTEPCWRRDLPPQLATSRDELHMSEATAREASTRTPGQISAWKMPCKGT